MAWRRCEACGHRFYAFEGVEGAICPECRRRADAESARLTAQIAAGRLLEQVFGEREVTPWNDTWYGPPWAWRSPS